MSSGGLCYSVCKRSINIYGVDMDQNTHQHTSHDDPAMNGDDELAKTLSGGLQFEETPVKNDDDDDLSMSNDSTSSSASPSNDPETEAETSTDDLPPSLSSLPAPGDFSMDDTSLSDSPSSTDTTDDSSSTPAATS